MRKWVVLTAVLFGLTFSSVARAHDPIILTSDQRSPIDGPLLPDGTISFALYGTLEYPGDTRGFRVTFAEGDPLYVSVLIPDLQPENLLDDVSLPSLEIVDPSGSTRRVAVGAKVPFAEPFTGTNYVRLAELVGTAIEGTYSITITGESPARFTVSVGAKELFGTEVENVPNRDVGVAGVMAWYETPPLTEATTTAPATTAPTSVVTTGPQIVEKGVEDDTSIPWPAIVVGVALVFGGITLVRRKFGQASS